MHFENSMTFVRSIKGAPASVLWALLFTRRAMTSLELQQWTGYKDDNIKLAVRLLTDLGWITARSARGPWSLAQGRQLPLTLESDLIGLEPASSTCSSHSLPLEQELQEEPESEKIGLCLAACDECIIREPARSRLASLPHVTPDLIRAHVAAAPNLGTAIYRIEHNWPVDGRRSDDVSRKIKRFVGEKSG